MSNEIKIAGSISFGGKRLNVYGDLNSINALQGAARNSSKGYIYKRKTED